MRLRCTEHNIEFKEFKVCFIYSVLSTVLFGMDIIQRMSNEQKGIVSIILITTFNYDRHWVHEFFNSNPDEDKGETPITYEFHDPQYVILIIQFRGYLM